MSDTIHTNPDFALANRVHSAVDELREAVAKAKERGLKVILYAQAGGDGIEKAAVSRSL